MGTEKMVVVVEVETTSGSLTAQQARALATAKRTSETEKMFENLMPRIEAKARNGCYSGKFRVEGDFYISASDEVCKRLVSLGYVAKRTGSYTTYTDFEISW